MLSGSSLEAASVPGACSHSIIIPYAEELVAHIANFYHVVILLAQNALKQQCDIKSRMVDVLV